MRRMLFSGWLMGSGFASASVPQSVSWMSTENTQVGGAWNLEAEGRKPAEKANSDPAHDALPFVYSIHCWRLVHCCSVQCAGLLLLLTTFEASSGLESFLYER